MDSGIRFVKLFRGPCYEADRICFSGPDIDISDNGLVGKRYFPFCFLHKAQDFLTNVGGIHIMQIFTDQVPITEDLAPFAVGIAKNQEIKELYKEWEILQFKSYIFKDEHLHAANKIVARRKEKI